MTYSLPLVIAEALSHMDRDSGLVFKSPVTGKELYSPKRQLSNLREHSGVEKLTLHYFRHILVSAMGESGTADSVLSASLGHEKNSEIVKTVYQSINHQKASQTANKTIEGILL